jgi:myo-inositol-1-phosphate synthase
VGRDVAEAIKAPPNNTQRFAEVASTGVRVQRGNTLDGLGKYLRDRIEESNEPVADVTGILRRTGTDILVSYLPVGSQQAAEWYAERALEAGCAFVNCMPVFIASRPEWRRRFEERGLPIIGDDIKSQVGATIVHRMLTNLFRERGVRLEGTTFGGVPLNVEVKLEVWDSPNSAGIVIDAVRCARLGLDRGLGGALVGPSSYFMKSPPEQFTDAVARERTLRFIAGDPPQGTA